MKLYFDLIVIGIAVQVATNMPNAVADVPEKFDAKFVTPNQHVYTGEHHLVMPEPGRGKKIPLGIESGSEDIHDVAMI